MKKKKYSIGLATILILCFIISGAIFNNSNLTLGNKGPNKDVATTLDKNEKPSSNTVGKEENKEEVETVLQGNAAEIHFINTGNSDSILIISEDKSVLIDGGDNDDEQLVANYIKNKGIKKLTYVISTHPDADHCGGLDGVVSSLDVGQVFVANGSAETKTYTDFINAAANKGLSPSVPLEGSEYELTKGSYIKFFNTNGGSDSNESSLVTLFVNGEDKFLFMGDAEEETEREIINQLCDVDVLKIGHHGSKTSTTQEFLNKVNPEFAVILVGANNKYNHPASAPMALLQNKGVELHRTDECGDIIFKSTGKGVSTSCGKASFTPGDKNGTSTSGNTKGDSSNTVTPPLVGDTVADNGKFIITESGSKYHLPSCSTIKKVKAEVTREEAEAQGYEPCGRCHP